MMLEKAKLIAYLSDLCVANSPICIDIAGRWVGGNETLYLAYKGLMEEVETWPDVMTDDGK